MKFTEILKKANHNTWNRKLRSILTVLSVTVGATTLTLAVALGSGAQSLVQESLNNQVLENAVSVYKYQVEEESPFEDEQKGVPKFDPAKLDQQIAEISREALNVTQSEFDQIGQIDGVESVFRLYRAPALFLTIDGQDFLANVSSANPNTQYKQLHGETITALDQPGIMISKSYAESLEIAETDLIGKSVIVNFINPNTKQATKKTLPVIGVMADIFGGFPSIVNYNTVKDAAIELKLETTNSLIATLKPDHRGESQINEVINKIEKINPQLNASSPAEELGEAQTAIRIFQYGLIGFASIVLLAALFGISNTLLMSVLERTQDIGLMRALGAKRLDIFSMFAVESSLIGFWGAFSGITIGMILGAIVNAIFRNLSPETFTGDVSMLEFQLLPLLGIVAALMFISLLAGILPARKAAKTNVIDALRYE